VRILGPADSPRPPCPFSAGAVTGETGRLGEVISNPDAAYRAVETRDRRFDGQFYTAVRTTRIYCRPGCPARTPHRRNVDFYPTSAAAQAAGYRACKRCLPDAAPGSPQWNLRADTVGAAMRLIGDGVVDREGVPGLAARLGYTPRHLGRLLTAELGASPLALARARRAHSARMLLTSTSMSVSDVAFAAGFASIRQFNDTIREVFDTDPSSLRRVGHPSDTTPGTIDLRLPVRAPFAAGELLTFLAARTISGIETVTGRTYSRSLRLPAGSGLVRITFPDDVADPGSRPTAAVSLTLTELADLAPAVDRCRRLLDADADPVGIDAALATDPVLADAVSAMPGLRLPGAVDGPEILIRALLGQQISVAAARTGAARLAVLADERLPIPDDDITLLFPDPSAIAALGTQLIGGPRRRADTIVAAATAMADGELRVDAGRRTSELTAELVARQGIGPWTAGYVAMRVLGDSDVLLTGDLVLRQGAAALGIPATAGELGEHGARWSPFRSYAGMHLWRAAQPTNRTISAPAASRPM
jgi:AraC family transcriptional regulator of adaptative response / DNA-3-methyladenine glycosylase II